MKNLIKQLFLAILPGAHQFWNCHSRLRGNDRKISIFLRRLICFVTVICFSTQAFAVPLIRDAEIEHTLRLYADPIFKVGGLNPANVHIFIVEDDAINSYVAGGANMFIYTGLIMACPTPDMLIGVMAHESGHIVGGHLAQGAEQLKHAELGSILSFILGAAAGVAARDSSAAAAVISGGQSMVARNYLAFSRAHEEQADTFALEAMDKLGISAYGFLKVFELLRRDEREHGGTPDPYMLTHPLTAVRIDHVRNHVENSKIPEGQYPHKFDLPHQRMIAKLYGFLESPERTLMKYPLSNHSVPARMARAIAYYKMPDLKRSLQEMDSLIAQSPDDPFFHELKGQILFENDRPKEALASYQEAVRLLPDSPLILSDLAKVELAQGEAPLVPSAIAHLEKSILLDNSNADAWHLLATAYGKAGNNGMAALSLAEEALLEGDPKMALQQADEALASLKEDAPARQRAHDARAAALQMQREQKKQQDQSPF
ncbi:MAG: M48 family metalloprotease [Pseudomonadota bacterium]|nr:M48 family metalloprotease [Pseudomonadota bacterium]MDE3038466.1 M48 family metalloprotease [Pseudomonadota bacterium]